MLTIIRSNEDLYDLFINNSELLQYQQKDFHFKYPLIIFDGFLNIFRFTPIFLLFSCTHKTFNIDASIKRGKGKYFKYLMFDKETKIIELRNKNIYEERFFGVSMRKLIKKNAKIMLFVDALRDVDSNVSLLNYDVLYYILNYFGPFVNQM